MDRFYTQKQALETKEKKTTEKEKNLSDNQRNQYYFDWSNFEFCIWVLGVMLA